MNRRGFFGWLAKGLGTLFVALGADAKPRRFIPDPIPGSVASSPLGEFAGKHIFWGRAVADYNVRRSQLLEWADSEGHMEWTYALFPRRIAPEEIEGLDALTITPLNMTVDIDTLKSL